MNPTPEQMGDAYKKLPEPVRAYIASTKLFELLQELAGTYGLHVDTVGLIAQAATNMLLGLSSPVQFQSELAQMGVPDASADAIISALNERVFKVLRDEIRNAPPAEPQEEPTPEPIPAPTPVATPIPEESAPLYVAPMPVKQPPPPPAIFAQASAPIKQPEIPQESAPTMPRYEPLAPKETGLPMPTMPPASYSSIPSVPSVPTPLPAQLPSMAPYIQPVSVPVPLPTPILPEPPQMPPVQPQWRPTPAGTPAQDPQTTAAPTTKDSLHAVLKNYGVDPYRETPE